MEIWSVYVEGKKDKGYELEENKYKGSDAGKGKNNMHWTLKNSCEKELIKEPTNTTQEMIDNMKIHSHEHEHGRDNLGEESVEGMKIEKEEMTWGMRKLEKESMPRMKMIPTKRGKRWKHDLDS